MKAPPNRDHGVHHHKYEYPTLEHMPIHKLAHRPNKNPIERYGKDYTDALMAAPDKEISTQNS